MRILAVVLVSLLFFSCEKKELPVPKYVPPAAPADTASGSTAGPLIVAQVDMSSDYRNQVWFSLSENRIVYANLKTDWDLAFECSPSGWHLMLNGSKSMKVFKTNFEKLEDVKDTVGLGSNGKADVPSGNLDSTAVGSWQLDNKVYVINLGYNELGKLIGYIKLKLISVDNNGYTFEFGDVYGTETYQGSVLKNAQKNFVAYSFASRMQINTVEPDKSSYDLCFTNYTHLFLEPLQYYQVTGVLSNSYKTRIARFSGIPFYKMTKKDTAGKTFVNDRNGIGYDWKSFNLEKNLYSVNLNMCYIIQDSKGFYYKLHFLDFYNSSGLKGSPKFEFQRL
ncbi:MAG: HmuY family protein [Bacteroidia bacterium]|nr:HmuY family protein [Bacteroidia bacterium]